MSGVLEDLKKEKEEMITDKIQIQTKLERKMV